MGTRLRLYWQPIWKHYRPASYIYAVKKRDQINFNEGKKQQHSLWQSGHIDIPRYMWIWLTTIWRIHINDICHLDHQRFVLHFVRYFVYIEQNIAPYLLNIGILNLHCMIVLTLCQHWNAWYIFWRWEKTASSHI